MSVSVHPALPEMTGNYLFQQIGKQAVDWEAAHPGERMISFGIGDVTQPLAPVVAEALRIAAAEMATHRHRRGYGPAAGYDFLRQAIANEYAGYDEIISPEEITVTHGAKEAISDILTLFDPRTPVWICDPGYPAYREIAQSAGFSVHSIPRTEENNFLPLPGDISEPGIVFLCSPDNPTGAAFSLAAWQAWVDFARENGSILIADAAYAAYLAEDALPRSVFAASGARECAIEIGSFSKSDGFTGLRCGWIVLPEGLRASGVALAPCWRRRLACRSNGVGYPVQRAAEAALSPTGKRQGAAALSVYRRCSELLSRHFIEANISFWGGKNAPYLWAKCPSGTDSEILARRLLEERGVVVTPGEGFGALGRGYLRIAAFAGEKDTAEAIRRMSGIL